MDKSIYERNMERIAEAQEKVLIDTDCLDPQNSEVVASTLENSAKEIRELAKVYNTEKGK